MTLRLALTVALVLTVGSSSSLAYLKLGAILDGRVIDTTWKQQPIGYFISDRPGNGVTAMDRWPLHSARRRPGRASNPRHFGSRSRA